MLCRKGNYTANDCPFNGRFGWGYRFLHGPVNKPVCTGWWRI
jgi:hypothetical protein